jgi:signal transduction histidine kinase
VTVGGVYILYRRRLMQRFRSLRWTLLAIIALTVALIFVNVWVTAQLMFISEHDLVLTSGLLVFAGLIALTSVLYISGTLTDRIHELAVAAQRLARGELKTRLQVAGNDELAALARNFNEMAGALEAVDQQKRLLEQARRDLIAWVSHDLRTPLAAIRAMNEAVLDGIVTDAETQRRYQQTIGREVQHLSQLIDDLFAMAQLDTGRQTLHREPTSLRDLISDTLGGLSARAQQAGVRLRGEVAPDPLMAHVAPDKIQRVLYNLLDNALQHTPSGGTVTLTAGEGEGGLCVSVHNTGSYIAEFDLPHVFESFYRGEPSRRQADNGARGTGLGLAIARGFIQAHGGTITVESDPTRGTTFTFTLPHNSQ